jgi:hypothetical protein
MTINTHYLFQAIETTAHGPTDFKGLRYTARCQAKRLTVSCDHSKTSTWNHTNAARLLAEKMDWQGAWFGGAKADGKGYAFVQVDCDNAAAFTIAKPATATA